MQVFFDVKSINLNLNEAWLFNDITLFQGRKLVKLFNKAIINQKKVNFHRSKESAIFRWTQRDFKWPFDKISTFSPYFVNITRD